MVGKEKTSVREKEKFLKYISGIVPTIAGSIR
jgi:hypothetical protein